VMERVGDHILKREMSTSEVETETEVEVDEHERAFVAWFNTAIALPSRAERYAAVLNSYGDVSRCFNGDASSVLCAMSRRFELVFPPHANANSLALTGSVHALNSLARIVAWADSTMGCSVHPHFVSDLVSAKTTTSLRALLFALTKVVEKNAESHEQGKPSLSRAVVVAVRSSAIAAHALVSILDEELV